MFALKSLSKAIPVVARQSVWSMRTMAVVAQEPSFSQMVDMYFDEVFANTFVFSALGSDIHRMGRICAVGAEGVRHDAEF